MPKDIQQNPPIFNLPVEIMAKILSSLDGDDVANARQACYPFCEVFEDFRFMMKGRTCVGQIQIIDKSLSLWIHAARENRYVEFADTPDWDFCFRNANVPKLFITTNNNLNPEFIRDRIRVFDKNELLSYKGKSIGQQLINVFEQYPETYQLELEEWTENLATSNKLISVNIENCINKLEDIEQLLRTTERVICKMTFDEFCKFEAFFQTLEDDQFEFMAWEITLIDDVLNEDDVMEHVYLNWMNEALRFCKHRFTTFYENGVVTFARVVPRR